MTREKFVLLAVISTFAGILHGSASFPASFAFSTNGHTIYHLRCATVSDNGDTVLIGAAYDGAVVCYSTDGRLIWKNTTSTGFPLDLDVADIDGDGLDETLVAAADGGLYAFSHKGETLWTFSREPPLLQVCTLKTPQGETIILTGGIERKLYAISAGGKVLNSVEYEFVVRHIRAGDILGTGKEVAVVITARNDQSRFEMRMVDPDGLQDVWAKPLALKKNNATEGSEFHVPWAGNKVPIVSVLVTDFDGDGIEDIGLSDYDAKRGGLKVYDQAGRMILEASGTAPKRKPYQMNLLTRVRTGGDRVLGLYGNQILLYQMDGRIEKYLEGPYSLTCCTFDEKTNVAWFGSSVSGGDGIYGFKLDHPGWEAAFNQLKPVGRMAEIEDNLRILNQQIADFIPPSYQPPPRKTQVVTGKSAEDIASLFFENSTYRNVAFTQFNLLTEDFDRSYLEGAWSSKRESRHPYNYTAEQIIEFASEREQLGQPFALWAGHGNDPFYMQLSTIKGVLDAAPTTCMALVYPEMTSVDADMEYAVRTHIIPVIELCRSHGTAKVVLRNKAGFWNANCYLDLWRETLLNGRYNDVIIPSMEETNGRNQAITLSARMGLWLSGHFDRISGRAVTDNANFSRFWEWSAQQSLSHLVRSLALRASLGADIFLVNIYQGDERDMVPFYRMIENGVLAIPERKDLLSVSGLCIGMMKPAGSYVAAGNNGHTMNTYQPDSPPAFFDRLDCFWGGAPVPGHDFSRYAMGSQRRMLNFLPTNPYGLVAILPAETDMERFPWFDSMILTDGVDTYDSQGKAIPAPVARAGIESQLQAAADKLPVRVRGEVAWTVVRLDPHHVRVTLIDPGYIDPAQREAVVILQHLDGIACRDILSRENLELEGNSITLSVPAGSLRVVDVSHD